MTYETPFLKTCQTCRFFKSGWFASRKDDLCMRYPTSVVVPNGNHWCGEYQPDKFIEEGEPSADH